MQTKWPRWRQHYVKKLKVASSERPPGSKTLVVATETKETVAFRSPLLQRQSAIDYIAQGRVPGD